jgi:hypothetical protein
MTVRLSALCAGRLLPPGRFLVLVSVRGSVDPRAIVRLEGLGIFKKSNNLIGIRTRDLPACSIVPQPTALPRASNWVHLVLRPLFGLWYQPRMMYDECGAIGRMRIGRGNRSTQKKPAPVPFCPLQIPHDLTRFRTRAAEVGSRGLTA